MKRVAPKDGSSVQLIVAIFDLGFLFRGEDSFKAENVFLDGGERGLAFRVRIGTVY
jgi:hypothetical protein